MGLAQNNRPSNGGFFVPAISCRYPSQLDHKPAQPYRLG
jgi:hypothetical protein